MDRTSQWALDFRPGCWVRVQDFNSDRKVYLRLRVEGEGGSARFRVCTAIMDGPSAISSRMWRTVPFDSVELLAQQTRNREKLLKPAEPGAPDLDHLDAYFDQAGEDVEHGALTTDPDVSLAVDHTNEEGYVPNPLTRPEGRITDEFLVDLAVMYRWLTSQQRAPAPAIAQQTGAPVRTVHGWITRARERGHLPKAKRGRAG